MNKIFSVLLIVIVLILASAFLAQGIKIHPIKITATASDCIDNKYGSDNLVDGNLDTNWQFSISSTNEMKEHYVILTLTDSAHIEEIWLANGGKKEPNKSNDQYRRNGRIKDVEISVKYEGDMTYTSVEYQLLEDKPAEIGWDKIKLSLRGKVTHIRVQAHSYYNDNAKNPYDIILSEIRVMGW